MQIAQQLSRQSGTTRPVRILVTTCAVAALIALALEFGFEQPPVPLWLLLGVEFAAVVVYLASRLHLIWTGNLRDGRRAALRSCWLDGALLAGGALFLLIESQRVASPLVNVSAAYIAAMQILVLIRLLAAGFSLNLTLARGDLHPTRALVLTFVGLIVLGGIALSLPAATQPHVRADLSSPGSIARHVLNGVFTATSATCVTGLAVYDTGKDLTLLGQIVVLMLIQFGGLGIMIFGSVFGLLVGRQFSLKQSLVLQDALSYRTLGQLRTMVFFIVAFTLLAEAVGAVVLFPMWTDIASPYLRVFHSVFHSVSAFCNAGFALQSDSLVSHSRSWQVYGCIVPLVVLGGLGFPVLHDLWRGLLAGLARAASKIGRRGVSFHKPPMPRYRFGLHTKLVLITSALLIVVGTLGFALFETVGARRIDVTLTADVVVDGSQQAARAGSVWLDAAFLSVTCRTAGFNTVAMDPSSMTPASHLLAAILMFVGGSPASTAGGIKTVGLAVLLLGVWSTMRGRPNVEAFGRTIPDVTVRRASVVVIVMLALVSVVMLTLCATEGVSLREALFESVSACGTVGLSTGLTPNLTVPGRMAVMAAMLAGRLGPLTMLIALAGRTRSAQYAYPLESVTIG